MARIEFIPVICGSRILNIKHRITKFITKPSGMKVNPNELK